MSILFLYAEGNPLSIQKENICYNGATTNIEKLKSDKERLL